MIFDSALGDLLPLAVGIAISPIPIIAVILILLLIIIGAKLLGEGLDALP